MMLRKRSGFLLGLKGLFSVATTTCISFRGRETLLAMILMIFNQIQFGIRISADSVRRSFIITYICHSPSSQIGCLTRCVRVENMLFNRFETFHQQQKRRPASKFILIQICSRFFFTKGRVPPPPFLSSHVSPLPKEFQVDKRGKNRFPPPFPLFWWWGYGPVGCPCGTAPSFWSINCAQCRWRIAGSRNSPTKGQKTVHFFTTSWWV